MSAAGGGDAVESRQLRSLGEMLRVWADLYVRLGEHIQDTRAFLAAHPRLTGEASETLRFRLQWMLQLCKDHDLPVGCELLAKKVDTPPQNEGEFGVLADALLAELHGRLFCYVPLHLARYYDSDAVLSPRASAAFPRADGELREGGTALACGLPTACVFHAMRAVEVGARALARGLRVEFPNRPLEYAELQPIISEIEKKIKEISQRERSESKAADQEFYSMAASQFRYFKDGWRVRAAHAREGFTEGEAMRVIDHVRDFFETLSERLSE